ncbi:MAG: hypothetical protein SV765_07640 [Pseudomonadota bacterium]|nr:hypothetical protein [Pseudomonadota bacterium]
MQVPSMHIRLLLLILFTLTGCGGGGGGSGSDASPGRNDNTPQPQPTDEQVGVFTDGPVSGLFYRQNTSIEGYTEDGKFRYDANSPDPVCFYIGEVKLGCATGAARLTPYHLAMPGNPPSLQSGYNISRLLISLDQSITEDIQLPESSRQAKGYVNFGLSDGQFANDPVVSDLLERYSPEGGMATREMVESHLAENQEVQQAMEQLRTTLDQRIAGMDVRWNSTLDQSGVLAHIRARTAGDPTQVQHLYLEVQRSSDGTFHLDKVTHITAAEHYVHIRWREDGYPSRVSRDGKVYGYLNFINSTLDDWAATSSYQPKRTGYLIGDGGFEDRTETQHIPPQAVADLRHQLAELETGTLSQEALLRIASHAMKVVQSVRCAESDAEQCDVALAEALLLAGSDTNYHNRVVSWIPAYLEPDLCLLSDEEPDRCRFLPNLVEFNLVMGQDFDAYSGMSKYNPDILYRYQDPDRYWSENPTAFFPALQVWLRVLEHGIFIWHPLVCEIELVEYQFADGVQYLGVLGGAAGCYDPRDYPRGYFYTFEFPACNALDYNGTSCNRHGAVDMTLPHPLNYNYTVPEDELALALKVAEKFVTAGAGFVLRKYEETENSISYINEDGRSAVPVVNTVSETYYLSNGAPGPYDTSTIPFKAGITRNKSYSNFLVLYLDIGGEFVDINGTRATVYLDGRWPQ